MVTERYALLMYLIFGKSVFKSGLRESLCDGSSLKKIIALTVHESIPHPFQFVVHIHAVVGDSVMFVVEAESLNKATNNTKLNYSSTLQFTDRFWI